MTAFLFGSELRESSSISMFLKTQVKNIFIFLKDRNAANPALGHRKKLHVFDYSCSCCWAECLAGSNSSTNCGFSSFFPPSSCFSHLSSFLSCSFTLFPLTLSRSLWTHSAEHPHRCDHRQSVSEVVRASSLCWDNECLGKKHWRNFPLTEQWFRNPKAGPF